ncbi:MAG: hypothetical protein FJY77_02655 [Candidatus Altiarchaeales archaeon]|nr:hypothetical protein [Candidatus Altiarchaeales archaeon]
MKPAKGFKQVVKAINQELEYIPTDHNTKEFLEQLFNIKLNLKKDYVKVHVSPYRRKGAIVKDYTQRKFIGHHLDAKELLEKCGKSRFTKKLLKALEKTRKRT